MPLSNSTKVSAGQSRCCSSSLVTSWPGFSRRISNTAKGWSWSLMRTPCLRSSRADGSTSKTPNRKGPVVAGQYSAMNLRQVPIRASVSSPLCRDYCELTADVDLSPGLPTARVKAMSENVGYIVVEAMQPEMTLGLLLSRNSTRQTQVGIDIFQGPASNKSMKSDHS